MSARILIVDDHAVVRAGLAMLVNAEDDLGGGRRGRRRAREAIFEARDHEARRRPDGRGDARPERDRGRPAAPARAPRREGARPLDAGRPALRARGVRGRRERLRAQGGRRHRARRGDPRGRGRRPLRASELGARLVSAETDGAAPRGGGSALRPRARGLAPARARPHEPGDREAALHLGAHGGDAPGAHHAEAAVSSRAELRSLRIDEGLSNLPEYENGPPGGACASSDGGFRPGVYSGCGLGRGLALPQDSEDRLRIAKRAADREDREPEPTLSSRRSRPPLRRGRSGRPCSWR